VVPRIDAKCLAGARIWHGEPHLAASDRTQPHTPVIKVPASQGSASPLRPVVYLQSVINVENMFWPFQLIEGT
jgi:hypothetical protein